MDKVKIYRNTAKLKEIDLFYMDTKTKGPIIVCLHGRWGRAETWYDFIKHYGNKYRIIAPDQRGHGLSSKPNSMYTAEEMADDIKELLDFLNIESVILVGHSMGARIAGHFAAKYNNRVKALALLDKSASKHPSSVELPLDKISSIDPLTKDWPLPFSSLGEAKSFLKSNMDSELGYQYFMNSLIETKEGYNMMFSSQAMAANIAYDTDWFHILPKIKCFVMLLRSNSHEAVSNEDLTKMQASLSNSMICEVSHPNHNVHLVNKESFYGCFNDFLARLK